MKRILLLVIGGILVSIPILFVAGLTVHDLGWGFLLMEILILSGVLGILSLGLILINKSRELK